MSQQIVANVKADLVGRGVNLTGPCGAFAITCRVAWALREQGWGLFGGKSPAQNGCTVNGERYAIDGLVSSTGDVFDILVNGGGDEDAAGKPIPGTGNGPAWQFKGGGAKAVWRAPFNPDPVAPPVVEPVPDPGGSVPSSGSSNADLERLLTQMRGMLQTLLDRPAPVYHAAGRVPFFGDVSATLKPEPRS